MDNLSNTQNSQFPIDLTQPTPNESPITPTRVWSNSDTIHENLAGNRAGNTRVRAVNWTIKDECLWPVSFLNISKDRIVGNAQKEVDYWKRTSKFYNDNRKEEQAERAGNHCKQH